MTDFPHDGTRTEIAGYFMQALVENDDLRLHVAASGGASNFSDFAFSAADNFIELRGDDQPLDDSPEGIAAALRTFREYGAEQVRIEISEEGAVTFSAAYGQ